MIALCATCGAVPALRNNTNCLACWRTWWTNALRDNAARGTR